MIREFDLEKLTNEKAEAITKMLDGQEGPIMSLSKARSEFKTLDLNPGIFETLIKETKDGKRSVTLTDYLEKQDPSSNYKPILNKGKLIFMDAFERQLMVRDLVVSGPNAVQLEAFFTSSTNRVLFPEFVNRNILAGRLMSDVDLMVDDLIAGTVEIDSNAYRAISADWDDQDVQQANISEGAKFPALVLTLGEAVVQLMKLGGKVKATYEFFRRIRANQFALILQFVGMQYERDQADQALDVILNGNAGNSNPAVNTNTAVTGTLDYADMVRWRLGFRPYGQRLIIASETRAGDILLTDEFMDPNAGFNYQATGSLISPFNTTLRISDDIGDTMIAGVDPRFALERVVERASSITESQKIMDGQFNEIYFSQVIGYSKMFEDASKTLTINW